jgi:hypothetical protein
MPLPSMHMRDAVNKRPFYVNDDRSEHGAARGPNWRRHGICLTRNGADVRYVPSDGRGAELKIALDETRMLILGAQVLLGFQMRSVFQDALEQIPTFEAAGARLAFGLRTRR